MKLAVFFPGIGYQCDRPLLYYSERIARQYHYETVKLSYTGLSRQVDEALAEAIMQTEGYLKEIMWERYEEILFVSKSIGTAAACAYAARYNLKCRNVYYTPLEQTFQFAPQPGIAFHGTNDSWAQTEKIKEKCRQNNLPLQIMEGANHSLEMIDNTRRTLQILTEVMEWTEDYISAGSFEG